MKSGRLAIAAGIILAVSASAWAVPYVPLPGVKDMVMAAHDGYAEIFVRVAEDTEISLPGAPGSLSLKAGIYNDIAIGYVRDADPGTGGNQSRFVLYQGATSTAHPGPTYPTDASNGANAIVYVDPDPNGSYFAAVFTGQANANVRGELYVVGRIMEIRDQVDGQPFVRYSTDPEGTTTTPELTYVLYNAPVKTMAMDDNTVYTTRKIETTFVLNDEQTGERLHVDVYADTIPANASIVPGTRYGSAPGTNPLLQPELPIRDPAIPDDPNNPSAGLLVDLDDGTYYNRFGNPGLTNIDFGGDPGNLNEGLMWSFVGNPHEDAEFVITEDFQIGGAGVEFFVDPNTGLTVYTQGDSGTFEVSDEGILIPGPSSSPKATFQTNVDYGSGTGGEIAGFLNWKLRTGEDYKLSGAFRFGGVTGAYDSDPDTFTFQQQPIGSVTLTQLSGPLLVPEPVTMLGVLLAVGGIGGYLRRRRDR